MSQTRDPLLQAMLMFAVLRSLTPFIPIPWVDGIVEKALLENLYRGVGRANHRHFTAKEIRVLIEEDGGCLNTLKGCLLGVLLFPLRSLRLLKVLVFTPLQYKKVIDRASKTFVEAYIVHFILESGRWPEGRTEVVRAVRDEVCKEVGTQPVEHLFNVLAVQESRKRLQQAYELLLKLARSVRGARDEERETVATQVLDSLDTQVLNPLVESLMERAPLLEQYLQQLRKVTLERLEQALQAPPPVS